jgi:hypothetical protein
MAHGLEVAAVARKSGANTFGIVAGNFNTIGTPAEIGLLYSHAAIMQTFCLTTRVFPQEKVVLKSWFGDTPRRRGTRLTVAPVSRVSSTVASFSATDKRRRRSVPG